MEKTKELENKAENEEDNKTEKVDDIEESNQKENNENEQKDIEEKKDNEDNKANNDIEQENENQNENENDNKQENIENSEQETINKEEQKKENEEIEETDEINEEKQSNSKKKKSRKNILVAFLIILLIALITSAVLLYIMIINPVKRKLTVEVGKEQLLITDFLINKGEEKNAVFVTDVSQIDLTKVGDYDIEINHRNKVRKVKLHLVDTTAPTVVFQDIEKYSNYEIVADDFILEKSDFSEMKVELENVPEINDFDDYFVTVKVTDAYGNMVSKECKLSIILLKENYDLEFGQKLTKDQLLYNVEKDGEYLPQEEIDRINNSPIGEYEIRIVVNEREFVCNIKVQDTTPPDLQLKDVSIYDDEKVSGKESFIASVSDISGDVTTTLKTEIDYSILGDQDIVIEAVDVNNNKIEKTAKLTIRKDTDGPVFSGLTTITVNKGASINYEKGVKAVDVKDGPASFTVDSSKVNLSAAGTYYATYTAKDKKGNTTTQKRKVVVNHNQTDTDAKFNEFYNSYLAGKSIKDIVSTVRNKIGYNHEWGGSDPVWYGLTNRTGNCYVHALIVQKALNKAGVTNQLIHTKDKTHYWNLVYSGGVWRHYDATPGSHILGPATDTEKYNSSALYKRDWDRSAYPKAE